MIQEGWGWKVPSLALFVGGCVIRALVYYSLQSNFHVCQNQMHLLEPLIVGPSNVITMVRESIYRIQNEITLGNNVRFAYGEGAFSVLRIGVWIYAVLQRIFPAQIIISLFRQEMLLVYGILLNAFAAFILHVRERKANLSNSVFSSSLLLLWWNPIMIVSSVLSPLPSLELAILVMIPILVIRRSFVSFVYGSILFAILIVMRVNFVVLFPAFTLCCTAGVCLLCRTCRYDNWRDNSCDGE